MDQGDHFQNQQQPYSPYDGQRGYDYYEQAPGRRSKRVLLERIFGVRLAARLRSPVFATVALLLAGAAFAGILMLSYPKNQDSDSVPVIQADAGSFKERPSESDNVHIPFRDNTIFTTMSGRPESEVEQPPIENLLEQEEPVDDRLEAFAAEAEAALSQMDEMVDTLGSEIERTEEAVTARLAESAKMPESSGESETPEPEIAEIVETPDMAETPETSPASRSADKPSVIKTITVARAESPSAGRGRHVSAERRAVARAAAKAPSQAQEPSPVGVAGVQPPLGHSPDVAGPPKMIHKPGSSPETLEFVRSVLNQKGEEALLAAKPTTEEASRVAQVAPAAGTTGTAAVAITPGSYFVQLASVTSPAGADSEWKKLKKKFSGQLQNASYRVKRADLGARGVYYRVQAGPMSKESALRICNAIKAQKPGGCLVIK